MIQYSLYLRAVTWHRDSHGLFDYESKNISKRSLKIQSLSKIVRTENDVEILPMNKSAKEMSLESQVLLQIG